ncbi:MAG: SufE family protein [Psychromonas sp.]
MSDTLIGLDQLINQFEDNKSWDKQYRLIIQLGKKLIKMSDKDKIDHNKVEGCESAAWLLIEKKEDCYFFQMDSETRVVKGLMMILMIIYQGKTVQQIRDINIDQIFEKLGLLNHLSPSRTNGLLAIVQKIQRI